MTCTCAPSLKALRDEANRRWPGRSTDSDGCCASPQHTAQNPTSDHETGSAYDLDHDPAAGVDTYHLADWLRLRCEKGEERRVAYVISNGRIATAWAKEGHPAWAWRHYTGANAHSHHMHVSLNTKDPTTRGDKRPWFDGYGQPTPTMEDDVTPEQAQQIAETWQRVKNQEAIVDPRLLARLEELEKKVDALVTNGDALDVPALADRIADVLAARLKD